MKRADIKAGEEYIVAAPSVKLDEGRYVGAYKHVRVLDTEPVWYEQYLGWNTRRDQLPKVKVTLPDGSTRRVPDQSAKLADGAAYHADDAKRSVKVLVLTNTRYGYFGRKDPYEHAYISVVPISQVRMTKAAFDEARAAVEARVKAEEAAFDRAEKAKQVAAADRVARKDRLNELLAGTDIVAKVLSTEVVLTGSPQALLDAAEVLANA